MDNISFVVLSHGLSSNGLHIKESAPDLANNINFNRIYKIRRTNQMDEYFAIRSVRFFSAAFDWALQVEPDGATATPYSAGCNVIISVGWVVVGTGDYQV